MACVKTVLRLILVAIVGFSLANGDSAFVQKRSSGDAATDPIYLRKRSIRLTDNSDDLIAIAKRSADGIWSSTPPTYRYSFGLGKRSVDVKSKSSKGKAEQSFHEDKVIVNNYGKHRKPRVDGKFVAIQSASIDTRPIKLITDTKK